MTLVEPHPLKKSVTLIAALLVLGMNEQARPEHLDAPLDRIERRAREWRV